MISPLNPPVFKQGDPRWAKQRLGTNDSINLGSDGCLITCVAMMYDAFNAAADQTPATVDNTFTLQGGYAQKSLLIWGKIPQLVPNCIPDVTRYTANVPADVTELRSKLDGGFLAILEVRWQGKQNLPHYVFAVGYNGDDIIVNDPASGSQVGFSKKYFGTGNAAADILTTRYFYPASNPIPQITKPVQEPNMTAQEETDAYHIVLGREPEGTVPSGRSAMEFIRQAQGELTHTRANQEDAIRQAGLSVQALRDEVTQLQSDLATAQAAPTSWQASEKPDRRNRVTTTRVEVLDYSGQMPPALVEANQIVEQVTTFTFDGEEFARTEKSLLGGYWYGVPTRFLTEGEPVVNDIAVASTTPVNQAMHQSAAAAYGEVRSLIDRIKSLFKRSS